MSAESFISYEAFAGRLFFCLGALIVFLNGALLITVGIPAGVSFAEFIAEIVVTVIVGFLGMVMGGLMIYEERKKRKSV